MELILEKKNPGSQEKTVHKHTETASKVPLMEIFLKELPQVKCVIAGMGFCRHDAEDIIQDVSVEVLLQPPEYDTRVSALAWIKRVTVNKCITEYRRRKRFQRKAKTILQRRQRADRSPIKPDKQIIRKEELEMIRKALKNLDDSLLVPLLLRFFCGCNSNEIAAILDLKSSSVRTRLAKARMLLAKTLIKSEFENGK
ncbi:MAG: RNA polymerase sigma factor [Planctomycetota bacterium]|jgi:RNA polymerase sigma-70 factor (ECF subfamily)